MPGTVLGSFPFLADLLQCQISGVGFSIGLFGDPMEFSGLVFGEQEIIGSELVNMKGAPSTQTAKASALCAVQPFPKKPLHRNHLSKGPENFSYVYTFKAGRLFRHIP